MVGQTLGGGKIILVAYYNKIGNSENFKGQDYC